MALKYIKYNASKLQLLFHVGLNGFQDFNQLHTFVDLVAMLWLGLGFRAHSGSIEDGFFRWVSRCLNQLHTYVDFVAIRAQFASYTLHP